MITLFINSCGRLDLIRQTLDSFHASCDYPFERTLIVDDSHDPHTERFLNDLQGVDVVYTRGIGQMQLLKKVAKMIETPYFVHLEDDWKFDKKLNLKKQLDLLQKVKASSVAFRHQSDNPHPYGDDLGGYHAPPLWDYHKGLTPDGWSGMNFNPSLKVTKDFQVAIEKASEEYEYSRIAHNLGQIGIVGKQCCYHIGYGRSTQGHD